MQTQDVVELLRDEGRREGRDEGRREGEKAVLLSLYRARFGAVPPEVEGANGEATLMGWLELFATKSAEEIAAGLTDSRAR